jgi:hypothetical protein
MGYWMPETPHWTYASEHHSLYCSISHPTDETQLLVQTAGIPALQGLYMRPDATTVFDGTWNTLLFGKSKENQNSNVQQLADRLNLESNGLTLYAPKGKRVVFGCSSRIRHSLAPDGSSITLHQKEICITTGFVA